MEGELGGGGKTAKGQRIKIAENTRQARARPPHATTRPEEAAATTCLQAPFLLGIPAWS